MVKETGTLFDSQSRDDAGTTNADAESVADNCRRVEFQAETLPTLEHLPEKMRKALILCLNK